MLSREILTAVALPDQAGSLGRLCTAIGALGGNVSRQKNRDDLNAVELMPRYLSDGTAPDIRATLFGRAYDAPFGVAPVGLSGLIWPRAERILAAAAKRHNIPYALSTVATMSWKAPW